MWQLVKMYGVLETYVFLELLDMNLMHSMKNLSMYSMFDYIINLQKKNKIKTQHTLDKDLLIVH
jgi:hypothetical protein